MYFWLQWLVVLYFLTQEEQDVDIKLKHTSSVDPGRVETEPQSASFEISRNDVEVGIW